MEVNAFNRHIIDENLTLNQLYCRCEEYYTEIVQKGNMTPANLRQDNQINEPDHILHTVISFILETIEVTRRAGVLGTNEEMEECSTEAIKFIYLHFFIGMILSKFTQTKPSERLSNLQSARQHFVEFLTTCWLYNYLQQEYHHFLNKAADTSAHGDDADQQKVAGFMNRDTKILKYKKQKQLRDQLVNIRKKLAEISEKSDAEEDLRSFYLLQLQLYVEETTEELPMIDMELQFLKMRMNEPTNDKDSIVKKEIAIDSTLPNYNERPGLSVTKLTKVGDQIVSTREVVRANVFIPRMEGPTMTLEEFADLELADAMRRQEAEKKAELDAVASRRYAQLEEAGEEDDEKLVDIATKKDREWDEWKEENPRGSGNKLGKRY